MENEDCQEEIDFIYSEDEIYDFEYEEGQMEDTWRELNMD